MCSLLARGRRLAVLADAAAGRDRRGVPAVLRRGHPCRADAAAELGPSALLFGKQAVALPGRGSKDIGRKREGGVWIQSSAHCGPGKRVTIGEAAHLGRDGPADGGAQNA
jgi:hypothetical protein